MASRWWAAAVQEVQQSADEGCFPWPIEKLQELADLYSVARKHYELRHDAGGHIHALGAVVMRERRLARIAAHPSPCLHDPWKYEIEDAHQYEYPEWIGTCEDGNK